MKRCLQSCIALALWAPALASAGPVLETEPNNSLAGAQSVDGHFTLDFSPDIGNGTHVDNTSLTIPHVTVLGSGDGSFDYYAFTFPGPGGASGFVVLDIDHSSPSFDSHVALWAPNGDLLGHNGDYDYRGGAGGSALHYNGVVSFDSLMTTYISAPGLYVVGVARAMTSPGPGPGAYSGGEPLVGDAYTLQISVEGVPVVPEPGPWMLMALGLGALACWRQHRAIPGRLDHRCPGGSRACLVRA